MVNVSFGFVEKNLQNLLNHTKNAMQKVNCFTLRCFSYIIVDKKQGRSKFFSVRELVLTMSIGNQISAIRNEQQLTQEQFGELFHVTRQTVSNWENEKSYPDLQILIAMSNQFDVSLDTLLKGDSKRAEKAIEKARSGEAVTIAFIGGSITQGAGAIPINTECYAYKAYQSFAKAYGTGENVHFVKAGVGGTPSELGMLRFERDVLRDGTIEPDIVIVEFAVNDEGDETKGNCYESLVRKILKLPNHPAVILLFSVFANDWNLQDRLSVVGKCYDLPMVSIMDAVTPQFKQKQGEGRVLSKNQFFYDIFHPSNIGHTIMADCLMHFFKEAVMHPEEKEDKTVELLEQKAAIGKTFEEVKLLDRKNYNEIAKVSCGCFEETDTELQCVEMDEDLTGTPEFPYNWMYCGKKEGVIPYFEMQICCKALVLIFKDAGDLSVGTADAYVDGKKVLTADPHVNGWVHCNPVILFTENLAKEHTIRIQMTAGEEDKNFTILGFGYVS